MPFFEDPELLEMLLRLTAALLIGGVIGLERTYRGRPAGFRTHAIVCLSTSLLMLISVYDSHWASDFAAGRLVLDPTRIAQGIMTGIGFLGAGTIIKEGFTVRGLTTAASIWMTASIGILIGVGFYFPAIAAAVMTFGTLSVFRWIEDRVPGQLYAEFSIRFPRAATMPEADLLQLVSAHGFVGGKLNYHLDAETDSFEYRMVIRTTGAQNASRLCTTLSGLTTVKEFRIFPTGTDPAAADP
jgi:putative Mg2+ transporter-C (MgtC) family protein